MTSNELPWGICKTQALSSFYLSCDNIPFGCVFVAVVIRVRAEIMKTVTFPPCVATVIQERQLVKNERHTLASLEALVFFSPYKLVESNSVAYLLRTRRQQNTLIPIHMDSLTVGIVYT